MEFENVESEDGVDHVNELVPEVEGDHIEFLIEERWKGQFAPPKPASEFTPSWYKHLEKWMGNPETSQQMTVAGCRPFFDAMTFGWIVPCPVDISVQVDGELKEWRSEWSGNFDAMDDHPLEQVGGEMFSADSEVIVKFNNPWTIRTPPGYSCLFIPPMNRPGLPFTPFSGVVDTDQYHNSINFPSLWTKPDFMGKVEMGTPVVQLIPFERDSTLGKSIRRTMTEDEAKAKELISNRVNRTTGYYSEDVWNSKEGERDVTEYNETDAPEGSSLDTDAPDETWDGGGVVPDESEDE